MGCSGISRILIWVNYPRLQTNTNTLWSKKHQTYHGAFYINFWSSPDPVQSSKTGSRNKKHIRSKAHQAQAMNSKPNFKIPRPNFHRQGKKILNPRELAFWILDTYQTSELGFELERFRICILLPFQIFSKQFCTDFKFKESAKTEK